jgi:hypothetical protein
LALVSSIKVRVARESRGLLVVIRNRLVKAAAFKSSLRDSLLNDDFVDANGQVCQYLDLVSVYLYSRSSPALRAGFQVFKAPQGHDATLALDEILQGAPAARLQHGVTGIYARRVSDVSMNLLCWRARLTER